MHLFEGMRRLDLYLDLFVREVYNKKNYKLFVKKESPKQIRILNKLFLLSSFSYEISLFVFT